MPSEQKNESESETTHRFPAEPARRVVRRVGEELVVALNLQALLPVGAASWIDVAVDRVTDEVPEVYEFPLGQLSEVVEILVRRKWIEVLGVTWRTRVLRLMTDQVHAEMRHRVCEVVRLPFLEGVGQGPLPLEAIDPLRWVAISCFLEKEADPDAAFLVAGYLVAFMGAQVESIPSEQSVREACEAALAAAGV